MRTALYHRHVELGAKMVSFAGFEMPLSYEGVVAEHEAVRKRVGLFDVSHMGLIEVEGPEAEAFLEFVTVGRLKGKSEGTALYSLMCNERGGCVDDLLVYKLAHKFWLVVNAANRAKDLEHLTLYKKGFDVAVRPLFDERAILALQGPRSEEILGFDPPEGHRGRFVDDIFIARTGYTGEMGFELYVPKERAQQVFDALIAKGATPCGLGARDTLRLDMGYALYGHELDEEMSPLESVAAWAIKGDRFLGKEALKEPKRRAVALLIDQGIARSGDRLFQNNQDIGIVTSGNFSPSLKQGIALGLVPRALFGPFQVDIRGKRIAAEEVELPFYKR